MSLTEIGGSLISLPVNDNFDYLHTFSKDIIKENIGYGIRSGLNVQAQTVPDMTVKVTSGVAYLPTGLRVQLPETNLSISNPSVVQHTNEPHDTDVNGIFTTDLMPIVDVNGSFAGVNDVTVTKVSDGTTVTVDSIAPDIGQIDTALTEITSVEVDYYHGQERIDIIVINTSGNLEVIEGTPANSNPSPPSTPVGALKLAEIYVKPKSVVSIESTDITNTSVIKGIHLDSNFNLVVEQDLIVKGAQSVGQVVNETLVVRDYLYNDQTGMALKINDDLNVVGNITLGGTVNGRDIASDGLTLDNHIAKEVDTSSTDTTKDKHVSNALAKGWEDHKNSVGNVHNTSHNQLNNIGQVDVTSTDTTKDKHVSNALAKGWEDHKNSPHLQLGETSTTAYRGDRGKIAYDHAISTGNAHNMDHADLNLILGVNTTSTNTTKDKHVSDALAKGWEDHKNASAPHPGHVKKSGDTITGTITLGNGALLRKTDSTNTTYTIIDNDAKVWRAVYNDLAEWFKKAEDNLEPGDLLAMSPNGVVKTQGILDRKVVGVYSDTFGFCLGGEAYENMMDNEKDHAPVAISGRVKAKVIGRASIGDFVVPSDIPGVGMISKEPVLGCTVGKVLEEKTSVNIKRIWILVMNS